MASSTEEGDESSYSSAYSSLREFDILPQPRSSTTGTFANLVLCILGVGVLGLPYTFSQVGWVLGIFTLLLGSTLAYHGMMLQLYSKCRLCESHGELDLIIASFGDLAYHTFGPWARLAVDVLLSLATFASTIAYITFISQNVASIVSSLQAKPVQGMLVQGSCHVALSTTEMWIVPAATNLSSTKIQLPKNPDVHNLSSVAHENFTSPRYIHELSYENGSSLWAMSTNLRFSAGSFVYTFLARINWSSSAIYTWCIFPLIVALSAIPSMTSLAPLSTLGNMLNIAALAAVMLSDALEIRVSGLQRMEAFGDMVAVPSAFGVGVYTFQSSGIMIPMETAMEHPQKLGSVLGLAFVLSGVLYAIFAVLGYAAFGTNTEQVITLNLQTGIEAVLIKVAISLSLFFACPLELIPMFELVERRFSQRKLSLGLRTLVVFVICLLATTVTQFTDFLSLAGSSISCLLGFILPAAMHIKAIKEGDETPHAGTLYAADYLLIAFGLIFGAFGTIVSFSKFL